MIREALKIFIRDWYKVYSVSRIGPLSSLVKGILNMTIKKDLGLE